MGEPVRIDKYTMLQLGQYKNIYQITEGYEDQGGEFKPSFCKRETGPRGKRIEKVMPVNVRIGEKDVAFFALLRFLKEITNIDYVPTGTSGGGAPTRELEDDVPF